MKSIFTNFRSPAIISFMLVLPLVIIEFMFNIVNKPNALGLKNVLDLIMLFGLLWLLSMAFIVILMPIVRNVRAGSSIMANPINLLLRVAFMVFIATMWGSILIDQLPCFLGVPNCD